VSIELPELRMPLGAETSSIVGVFDMKLDVIQSSCCAHEAIHLCAA
jgi:hypothetical protein